MGLIDVKSLPIHVLSEDKFVNKEQRKINSCAVYIRDFYPKKQMPSSSLSCQYIFAEDNRVSRILLFPIDSLLLKCPKVVL